MWLTLRSVRPAMTLEQSIAVLQQHCAQQKLWKQEEYWNLFLWQCIQICIEIHLN